MASGFDGRPWVKTKRPERVGVSRRGDPTERAADRIAARVLGGRGGRVEGEVVRPAPPGHALRLPEPPDPGVGRPLPRTERAYFEPRFGRDLSDVRIHTGDRAADSARQLGARAYTSGRDVVFGDGQFEPGAERGRQLLAHELAHVAQQGRAAVSSSAAILREESDESALEPSPELSGCDAKEKAWIGTWVAEALDWLEKTDSALLEPDEGNTLGFLWAFFKVQAADTVTVEALREDFSKIAATLKSTTYTCKHSYHPYCQSGKGAWTYGRIDEINICPSAIGAAHQGAFVLIHEASQIAGVSAASGTGEKYCGELSGLDRAKLRLTSDAYAGFAEACTGKRYWCSPH